MELSLICLTAGTEMLGHSASRNVSITVIEGCEIALQPGVFVYMPAKTRHALRALENLAFLHT